MGKMFKLCAALAIILCASAAAFAENYVEMDRSGTNVIYIDTDSIVDEGSYIIANTKVDIRTKEARDKFKERSGVDAQRPLPLPHLRLQQGREAGPVPLRALRLRHRRDGQPEPRILRKALARHPAALPRRKGLRLDNKLRRRAELAACVETQ